MGSHLFAFVYYSNFYDNIAYMFRHGYLNESRFSNDQKSMLGLTKQSLSRFGSTNSPILVCHWELN